MNRRVERIQMAVAWLLPRWLVKWAAIRLMAHATQGYWENQIVPELTALDALKRWSQTAPTAPPSEAASTDPRASGRGS